MRGDAENKTITKEVIDKTLDQASLIYRLVLTGGEPFLEPEIIEYLFSGIIKRQIPLLHVNVTTNGTIQNKDIAHSFNKIANYIVQKNPKLDAEKDKKLLRTLCQITISNDPYHSKIDFNAVTDFYRKYLNDHCIIRKEPTAKDERILSLGRAEQLTGKKKYAVTPYRVEVNAEGGTLTAIQIGHDGKVLIGEDSSYLQQDANNYGNILENSIADLLLNGAFNEPFTKAEAMRHDLIYSALMNKENLSGAEATDEETSALAFGLMYYELVYNARKRLSECYPLTYDEIVEAAYHESNLAIKDELGKDFEIYRLDGSPFEASYEESYKKRLQLQIKYPLNAIAAGLKYRGDAMETNEIPKKLDKSHYKKLKK